MLAFGPEVLSSVPTRGSSFSMGKTVDNYRSFGQSDENDEGEFPKDDGGRRGGEGGGEEEGERVHNPNP